MAVLSVLRPDIKCHCLRHLATPLELSGYLACTTVLVHRHHPVVNKQCDFICYIRHVGASRLHAAADFTCLNVHGIPKHQMQPIVSNRSLDAATLVGCHGEWTTAVLSRRP